MCTLKCLGGFGFKDLAMFNDALLGCQAWRLIRELSSLLGGVKKRNTTLAMTLLNASIGYSYSFSWGVRKHRSKKACYGMWVMV